MNYTTLAEAMEQAGFPVEVDALSVYRAFEQIRDGRGTLQQCVDLDLDRVGQIGGDDELGWDSRVGTVARGMVEPGATQSV